MTILTKKEREQLRKERIEAEQELEKYRKWESIIHEHLLLADEYDKKDIMERIKELKEKEKEIKKELNIK